MLLCACSSNEDENVFTGDTTEKPAYQAKLNAITPAAYSSVEGLELEPGTYISVIGKEEDSAYWNQIRAGVEQAAADLNEALGYSGSDQIKVLYNAPSGEEDMNEQVNILDEELARYPDVIAIASIDEDASEVQFDLAAGNDIPIVAFDSGNVYQGIQCTCKTDNSAATAEGVSKLCEAIGDSGEVALIVHDSVSESAREREEAFKAALSAEHPEVTIAETIYMDELEEIKKSAAAEQLGVSLEEIQAQQAAETTDQGEEQTGEASAVMEEINAAAEGMSDEVLRSVFDDIKRQGWFDYKGLRMEYSNPFYILGLSPNAARLSVRCFLAGTFGDFMIHIANHMERMAIVKPFFETGEFVSLWALLQETVSPKSQHKAVSPALAGAVLQAILTDQAYPEALYQAIILRIHADQGPGKVNYRRAAFIKAYLIKNKGRNMTVGLNEASTDRAYVLGRLFAALEYVQYKYDSKINTTIRDSYFDSACTRPAVVFPVLLKLANHHLAKLRKEKAGIARDMDRLICSLLKKLPGEEQVIPMHVSLSKQGEFILGYYHQREVLLARHNKEEA